MLAIAGGAAGLSWEVLWQVRASLALGVSAEGAAIVLAAVMGGAVLGALVAGRVLRGRAVARPLRVYGALELWVGAVGLGTPAAFGLIERLDGALGGPWVGPIGIAAAIGPSAMAMGATIPALGLVARRHGARPGLLYGANTLGAAAGALLLAFVAMPALGMQRCTWAVAGVDLTVGALAWILPIRPAPEAASEARRGAPISLGLSAVLVFATGYATFALEVAWFRALRSAFLDTAATFALLLASVLLPLALASVLAGRIGARSGIGRWVAAAGAVVLVTTPLVERMDAVSRVWLLSVEGSWLVQTLAVIGPAMLLLGTPLPWILDRQRDPLRWGGLYALNALGAVSGALSAAWVLLPALGFARTAGLVGALLILLSLAALRGRERLAALGALAAGLALAVGFGSGVGRTRTLGQLPGSSLVAFREDPDHTVSVVDTSEGRRLIIDGFEAAADRDAADYMAWMGRLPALLHPDPRSALVICFGTGQTANAVRREGVPTVEIAEVSAAVLDLAWAFPANEGVLDAPGTIAHRVDGRAALRRTRASYDIVTLEPMPPTFAGVNALYSREFYALVASRLRPGGIVAQWLPVHLTDPYRAAAIAATLVEVFPDAALWVHPASGTGVLLGRAPGGEGALGSAWPGLSRDRPGRTLPPEVVRSALILDGPAMARLAARGARITDDNQLLTYGADPRTLTEDSATARANAALVELARRGAEIRLPPPPHRSALGWGLLAVLLVVGGVAASRGG